MTLTRKVLRDLAASVQTDRRMPPGLVMMINADSLQRLELRDDDYIVFANDMSTRDGNKFGSRVDDASQAARCAACGFRIETGRALCEVCETRRRGSLPIAEQIIMQKAEREQRERARQMVPSPFRRALVMPEPNPFDVEFVEPPALDQQLTRELAALQAKQRREMAMMMGVPENLLKPGTTPVAEVKPAVKPKFEEKPRKRRIALDDE